MSEDHGHVMLVGSVARPEDGWDVEDVFRNAARSIGEHVSMLPDGEIGDRYFWINYVARRTYAEHPDMLTLSHHTVDDWKPKSYDDHWLFTIREGVKDIHFDRIGYADEAKKSYQIFRRLREQGVIPRGVRFMVAIPLIESATRPFIDTAAHFEMLWKAYGETITREVREICAAIPHEDLAIQWDICVEVAAVEGLEGFTGDLNYLESDPMRRYCDALRMVCAPIPADVRLGLHICYGSLSHESGSSSDAGHFCEIKDLNVSVDMANAGAQACARPVQFVQLSVQLSNGAKDAYYEPLRRLAIGDARVYLGLIHLHDGVDGALKRMAIARKYLPDFGISTQCGWGRRPLEQKIEDLLQLHADIAARCDWGAPAH
ncbi:MAG: hypothetical protein IT495_15900 [Gammaproteobacteria bacterium]|nr:hypothetical protein [Gammaproteobacteria bacterium]